MSTYLMIAFVGFAQNMVFTLNSRARQSADVMRHFWTAILSNGLWFVCTFMLVFPEMFKAVAFGSEQEKYTLLTIYTLSTAIGSAVMMKINIGDWNIKGLTEHGKSRVGAKIEQMGRDS